MSESRTKSSIRNIIYGFALQLVSILANLVTRIVLVRLLGKNINGLNGLFTEVISMLSLAEMGVGTAIIYSLYKPLNEKNEKRLSELMGLFKMAYRIIALVILVAGAALTPFIQHIVNGTDFSTRYIQGVFFLFVLQTASSYLFSYKASLLIADQKNYIISLVTSVFKILLMLINIATLYVTKNFVAYLASTIVVNFAMNYFISREADKRYAFLQDKAMLPKEERTEIFANIKHIFIGKVSGKITNSTDNILISVLVSTTAIGIYANYSMIFSAVKGLMQQTLNAISGSVGNLMASESAQKNNTVLRQMTFITYFLAAVISVGMYCCIDPLIELMFGADYILEHFAVVVSIVNMFLFILKEPLWNVMQVSGLFAKDKNISIIGSIVNLIVSVILGKYLGIAGIFIGTICTYIIQILMKIHLLYTERFELSQKEFYVFFTLLCVVFMAQLLGSYYLCAMISFHSLILTILVHGILSVVLTVATTTLIYHGTSEFHYLLRLTKQVLHMDKV